MHILGVFLICFQYYTQTTSAFSRQNFVRVATFRKPVFWKEQNDYSFVLNGASTQRMLLWKLLFQYKKRKGKSIKDWLEHYILVTNTMNNSSSTEKSIIKACFSFLEWNIWKLSSIVECYSTFKVWRPIK